ncbi:MAG: PIN domain-containing protein [Hyphomicrobiaceae bacterium]|nr:PIN domain-containing protein [Hyphomicrobiaceae bacterium]
MMVLDTSIIVDLLRDKTGRSARDLEAFLGGGEFLLSRISQFELLRGCRDERHWSELNSYLEVQNYIECDAASWVAASRTFYELRKSGRTLRSSFDCCIAQAALDRNLTLVHNDDDFEAIAEIRPLRQTRLDLKHAKGKR